MKVVLRRDHYIIGIEATHEGLTDDRWKEIDNNTIANLYLAFADSVLSAATEKTIMKKI